MKPIDCAPKDGTHINVLNPTDNKLYEAWWDPDGSSVVDGCVIVTGIWACKVDGWFEPGEVDFWEPIKNKNVQ